MSGPVQVARMTLAEIGRHILDFDAEAVRQLQTDPRQGARQLYWSFKQREKHRHRALSRRRQMMVQELQLSRSGAEAIVGLDEAGRGPLAGPVVAAAVMLPKPCRWLGVDDSKRLTARQRQRSARLIWTQAPAVGVGIVSAAHIDRVGIVEATWEAMRQAIRDLAVEPDYLLVDGAQPIPAIPIPQTALIGGDARSLSVAAASVIAKVTRDEIMGRYDEQYPQYGFSRHKGYGTREHQAALRRYGPCRIHRYSFQGVSFEDMKNGCQGRIPRSHR